ncbi:MAG TPA: hypothetical protein VJX66_10500 [Amycolatopsis sp.]|nr:hypothetical protein [Amycolatopsis sp.]
MCLLTFLPPGTQPDPQALANGAEANTDGHGFAIVTDDRLIVRRGLNGEQMISDFARHRAAHPAGPALFHSRFATHGSISKANIHPFPIGQDRLTVLAHNGVLPMTVRPRPGDRRSDTRIAAQEFLSAQPFLSLEHTATRSRIEQWLGPDNKLVVLTVNPRYPASAYLFNEDSGQWDNGIWYSNHDYLPDRYAGIDLDYWAPDAACPFCSTVGLFDPELGICLVCEACPVCGQRNGECSAFCYRTALLSQCPVCGDDPDSCQCLPALPARTA